MIPLKHGVEFKDSPFGPADRGGNPSFQEGRSKSGLQPWWDDGLQALRESLLLDFVEEDLSDCQTSGSGGTVGCSSQSWSALHLTLSKGHPCSF